MKKYIAVLMALSVWALPAQAATQFWRDANGQISVEITTCKQAQALMNALGLPDDPPGKDNPGDPSTNPDGDDDDTDPTTPASTLDPNVTQGIVTIANSVLDPLGEDPDAKTHGISADLENFLNTASFEERQDAFITFVRDVNWKTGLYITFRDFTFFRRLKMACQGINQLTTPMRVKLGVYAEELDETVNKATDVGVDQLARAAMEYSFADMSKLSIVGLIDAIDKKNPFLLLAIDEETYQKLVEHEPKIATLFEDMYTFFSIRSVRMGEFNQNIKALIDVVKIGKGDSFNTWHVMANYAKKMLELNRQNKLTVKDEREIHIWRLESSISYIHEQVHVERRAAEIAAKDPENANILKELSTEPKKRPSLDDKARELLQKSTQDEIKRLIRKYISK